MTAQKAAPEATAGRKGWVKKTPAEIVLEQINKQETRVAEMREKLQAARKVLEAK
jgi:hypothetical protein